MAEREIDWGGTNSPYRTTFDKSDDGRLRVAEDTSGGTVLLEYDEAANSGSGGWIYRGPVDMSDNDLSGVGTLSFLDTAEGVETIASASGTVTLDLSQANVWQLEAVDNLTIQFSNTTATPAGNAITVYVEDSDGAGPYTLSWPASVVWHNGDTQGEVAANSDIELSLLTPDGGSTWRGRLAGEAFA